ncbi:uncharacterized protein YgbK (DUF1537 family) [Limimaricola soesokkakensis]|uniref:Uncharacterized protein YgbK (DUF1537 family) n=1 Tax=Limimaricola soesokkakensis TaxID=1343159 RepID=A0A1X6YTU7_9RHOB|nr:four-carbon acid sugar kinase family protein [Limimaricola soesokkakensis]PSK87538.1 uncharacterized protein YgbK (DUF1537 family) [Limimaricola soesokkakensis]SLN30857.1 hypothetical protein LOS8367_01101 [Limimaricola soesokkakensis]
MTHNRSTDLLLAFYGDDFTGSTDAMEVTARAGLRTVLFTTPPTEADLAEFEDCPVIGVAGTSRARNPEWMEAHLGPILARLAELEPPILQYKVCSTFDSAPEVGSIGRATEIARRYLRPDWAPSIVGAPQLGRWQAFSNLFAAAGGTTYRIDRHPTMSRHPVTPMREADLRHHIGLQTHIETRSVDLGDMARGDDIKRLAEARERRAITFIDVADEISQQKAGELVWGHRDGPVFSPSSSGLQYALVSHWRRIGLVAETAPVMPSPKPTKRLLVLSGSCSPVTSEQIEAAEKAGFALLRLDVIAAQEKSTALTEKARLLTEAERSFESAKGVVIYAARTVDDPAFEALKRHARSNKGTFGDAQEAIGNLLAQIALEAVPRFELRRMVVAGGDTSGRVVETLPVKALEMLAHISPGAPLCRVHTDDPSFAGLELALKGGQLGSVDYFERALG